MRAWLVKPPFSSTRLTTARLNCASHGTSAPLWRSASVASLKVHHWGAVEQLPAWSAKGTQRTCLSVLSGNVISGRGSRLHTFTWNPYPSAHRFCSGGRLTSTRALDPDQFAGVTIVRT